MLYLLVLKNVELIAKILDFCYFDHLLVLPKNSEVGVHHNNFEENWKKKILHSLRVLKNTTSIILGSKMSDKSIF